MPWLTKKKKKGDKSVEKMSRRKSDSTEEQMLADALKYGGRGTEDLLQMLKLTKLETPMSQDQINDMFGNVTREPSLEAVRAHLQEGRVKLSSLDEPSQQYMPATSGGYAKDEVYRALTGGAVGDLSVADEKFMRKIMQDPALASYFMDIHGSKSRDTKKVRVANVGRGGTGGSSPTSPMGGSTKRRVSKCEGAGCKAVREGRAGY